MPSVCDGRGCEVGAQSCSNNPMAVLFTHKVGGGAVSFGTTFAATRDGATAAMPAEASRKECSRLGRHQQWACSLLWCCPGFAPRTEDQAAAAVSAFPGRGFWHEGRRCVGWRSTPGQRSRLIAPAATLARHIRRALSR
jgi:hypothetical protein